MNFRLTGEISFSKGRMYTLCLSLSTGKYFRVNTTGEMICKALQAINPEGISPLELSKIITDKNNMIDQSSVEQDVFEFLETLRQIGVVHRVAES